MATNRKIKITVLFFIVALFTDVIVCGQIKEVGDEYTNSLTASKSYYDKDVDFDRFFPSTTPQEEYGEMNKNLLKLANSGYGLNLTGDTLYLYKDITSFYGASFAVGLNGKYSVSTNIPQGYYIIDGYVFCIDNVNDIRNRYGFTVSRSNLGSNDYSGEWTTLKELKDKILKDEIKSHWDFLPFLRYMVIKPVDTLQTSGISKYYLLTTKVDGRGKIGGYGDIYSFIPLRFNNEAQKFIGKEVVLIAGMVDYTWNEEGFKPQEDAKVPNCFDLESDIIKDGFTKDLVKLQDSKFICKDVVLHGEGEFFVILNGEKTGSFAVKFDRIAYAKDSKDLGTKRQYSCYHEYRDDVKQLKKHFKLCDVPFLVTDYGYYVIESKNVTILDKREKMAQAQRDKEEQQKEAARKKEQEQRKNAYVQQMTSKYGAEYGELIGNKQIAIGMTKEMCKDAWGSPMDTYSTTTSFGQSEVWCYNYKTRVYFRNGKVSQIDN